MFPWIFGSVLAFTVIIFLFLLILLYLLESSKGRLYKLFLEVPSEYLRVLYARSETFVNMFSFRTNEDTTGSIQNSEAGENEGGSNESVSATSAEHFSKYYETQRNRKYKNEPRLIKQLLIGFLVTLPILFSFYISEYSIYVVYRSRAVDVVPTFNQVIRVFGPFYVVLNSLRSAFFFTLCLKKTNHDWKKQTVHV